MSKFKTTIPVDLDTIKKNLPPRSFVNDVAFDGENVVIEWENDDFKTPYTFAVEWADPNKVPAGVVDVKSAPPAPKPAAPRPAAARSSAPKMYPVVSGQQTSSQSPAKAAGTDAAATNVSSKPKSQGSKAK